MRHDSAKRSESVLNHRQRRLTSTHLCHTVALYSSSLHRGGERETAIGKKPPHSASNEARYICKWLISANVSQPSRRLHACTGSQPRLADLRREQLFSFRVRSPSPPHWMHRLRRDGGRDGWGVWGAGDTASRGRYPP